MFQQVSECNSGIASVVHNLFPFGIVIELYSFLLLFSSFYNGQY